MRGGKRSIELKLKTEGIYFPVRIKYHRNSEARDAQYLNEVS